MLHLEDAAQLTIAETTTTADGSYTFAHVPDSAGGYSVVFSQSWNPAQRGEGIMAWVWLGPAPVAGRAVDLPDLEISAQGMLPDLPANEAGFSRATISAQLPIAFVWPSYSATARYWLDVRLAPEMELVRQSSVLSETQYDWDGTTSGGALAAAGEYWWAVGVVDDMTPYTLKAYSLLSRFWIEP